MLGYLGLQRKIKSAPANEIMQFLIFFLAKSCIICNRFIGINWKLELFSVYTFEKMLTCLPKKDDKSIQSSEIVHCLKSSPIQVHLVPIRYSFPISLFYTAFIIHFLSSVLFINYNLTYDQVRSILSITRQSIHLNHIICAFIPCIHLYNIVNSLPQALPVLFSSKF